MDSLSCSWSQWEFFQLFTTENDDVSSGFVIYDLYCVEVGSLCAHFLKVVLFCFVFFYQKWVLCFVTGFFCVYWEGHTVFILQFVNAVYHTDWFVDTEEPLHPWDKSHLIMRYNPFECIAGFGLLVSCWGFLHLCSSMKLSCGFLFLCGIFGFGIRVMVAS